MGRFSVTYDVRGSMTTIIEAEDLDAAKEKADEFAYDDNSEFDLDEVDDVRVTVQTMTKVKRDGREIWTSYVYKTDEVIAE